MYCANHPNVETTLRCNNCNKPICARCAVRTPTGYRCKECVRGQQKVFETATWIDYPLIFVAVSALTFLGNLLAIRIGFFIILLAPIAGGVIAEIARRITGKRRSKRLYIVAAIAAVAGCIPLTVDLLLHINLFGIIYQALYAFLMVPAFYARLAGIRIG
jgi:hypothetical protein